MTRNYPSDYQYFVTVYNPVTGSLRTAYKGENKVDAMRKFLEKCPLATSKNIIVELYVLGNVTAQSFHTVR